MVTVQSLLKVNGDLIPVEEFTGPITDENYIEGALELSINHKPILTREQVDYIDQLWAYLIRGLAEIVAGHEFVTYYPDIPVKIVLRPDGDAVAMTVDTRKRVTDVSVRIEELLSAMVPAGILFFERLLRYMADGDWYAQELADLAALQKSGITHHG